MPEHTNIAVAIVALWAFAAGAFVGARTGSMPRGASAAFLILAAVGCLLALRAQWDGERPLAAWLAEGGARWPLVAAAVVCAIAAMVIVRSSAGNSGSEDTVPAADPGGETG